MLVIILIVVQIIIYGNSVGLAIGIGSIYLLLQLYGTKKKNRIDAHACSWAPGLSYSSAMMSHLYSLVLKLSHTTHVSKINILLLHPYTGLGLATPTPYT
jgi:hypothetical protein